MSQKNNNKFDCIIIGGGAAGLAAASVLARALRHVLVIDANQQSNTASRVAHSVFGHDGQPPEKLYIAARKQLARYPTVRVIKNTVVSAVQESSYTFAVTTLDGNEYRSRSVLLAQGVHYELPDIPGLAAIWGHEAWHCPYCDGYEHRDKKLLVISSSGGIDHMSLILPIWSTRLAYSCDKSDLPQELIDRIKQKNGSYRPYVASIQKGSSGLIVQFVDHTTENFDAIVVGPTITPTDTIAAELQCQRDSEGCVARDEHGRTSVQGIYTAGDQTDIMQQVNVAVASGHKAAVTINEDLARLDENS